MLMVGCTEAPWPVPWILLWESRLQSMLGTGFGESVLIQNRFVDYSMGRVRMLMHFGIIPYIVFDGDYLPSKALIEVERASRREESRKLGLELHRLGKISQANLELQKAVDVTPEMARQFIEELKKLGVQYLVAPYEADAQLAYLERKGIITGILSEDSDLLVFGAECLLTKLDQYGDCVEINRKDFTACREISLVGWSDTEFRLMAILSGCDYLASIGKMGLKTAYRLVRKHKSIEKILRMLAFDGKYHIPAGYLESFRKAELTFLHQRVFCPVACDLVMMTSLGAQPEPEDFSFIGSSVEKSIAIGISRGDLNPITKKPISVEVMTKGIPRTPWSSSKHQPSCSISDLKGNKSIEAFFKARRAPLAELDPNSFTPSPSQQRLLFQSERTWMSSPAPAQPPMPQSGPYIAATTSSSTSGTPRNSLSRIDGSQSLPHQLKRRRLCAEGGKEKDIIEQATATGMGRSRFFPPSLPEPSPLPKNRRTAKRRKSTEINIWSDDSVEDVMAGLPDLSEYQDQRQKVSIKAFQGKSVSSFKNTQLVSRPDEKSLQDPQRLSKFGASTKSNFLVNASEDTAETSPKPVAKVMNENMTVELAALSKELSYKGPPKECIPAQRSHLPQPQSNSRLITTKPALVRRGSLTPLQRLKAGALDRSQSCSDLINTAARLLPKPESMRRSAELQKTSGHSSRTDVKDALKRGSEDAIIPDSEDDSEGAVFLPEAEEQEKPKLNLEQFTFLG